MPTFWRMAALVGALLVIAAAPADGPRKIAVLDDCDPADPGWTPTGGCALADGDVTVAEFNAEVPNGHPAWRNEPSYLKVEADKHIDVSNDGGRRHTFTPVAAFGGGFVPPLNHPGQPIAPECAGGFASPAVQNSDLPPGAQRRIEGLAPGTYKFQCCIHPWMRAEVRVK